MFSPARESRTERPLQSSRTVRCQLRLCKSSKCRPAMTCRLARARLKREFTDMMSCRGPAKLARARKHHNNDTYCALIVRGARMMLWRRRLRPAGIKRPSQTFEGHQRFLALRFVEANRADGLLKECLQFGFGSVSGPVRHCRSFRPCCYSRALEQRRAKPHPSGPQRQRRSFTLATRTAAINDRQRTNTDGRGTAGATLTSSRPGIRTAAPLR